MHIHVRDTAAGSDNRANFADYIGFRSFRILINGHPNGNNNSR